MGRSVPKGITENLAYRRWLLLEARKSISVRKGIIAACRDDLLFYVNSFVWQYNPRKKGESPKVGPFVTWDFQDEAFQMIIYCIEHDEDLLIEKSREMGASWMCLIVMEWLWHFRPWNKFLCISRSEAAVEDDDPDSLFWKLDFIHRYLPDWLMPKKTKRKLYYGNDDNGSTITGQASTGRAGVGGRATAMFIDEFSQIKEDYEVLHRTSDTTGCRIFNGTHRGVGTAFHELSTRVDMKKLVMHWTQHPDKNKGLYRYDHATNKVEVLDKTYHFPVDFDFVLAEAPAGGPYPGIRSPWYDRECGRKGSPRAVAMDLDIDAGGSVAQFFNPMTLRSLIATYCCPPYWEGDINCDKDTGRPIGLVKNPGGPLKLWLHPTAEGKMPVGRFGAGADLATGLGATNSVLSIGNSATGEKVLEYASPNLRPEAFAPIVMALCWLFVDEFGDPCLLSWEHAGPGLMFGKCVIELGYRRIYYREGHQTLAGGKQSDSPGWYPTPQQKRILLEEYRADLDSRSLINRSEPAIRECLPYRYKQNGDVEHPSDSGSDDPTGARVNHGDRTIADALMGKMVRQLGGARAAKKQEEKVAVGTLAWRRMIVDNKMREEEACL